MLNLPANVLTILAFFRQSSLLSYLSQKMSLNIDINWILPVKVSGVCPKELRRSLILPQSCNVVNPGKMFHSNSVVSLGSYSRNSVLSSFVAFRMLNTFAEAQHRI